VIYHILFILKMHGTTNLKYIYAILMSYAITRSKCVRAYSPILFSTCTKHLGASVVSEIHFLSFPFSRLFATDLKCGNNVLRVTLWSSMHYFLLYTSNNRQYCLTFLYIHKTQKNTIIRSHIKRRRQYIFIFL
jgi:hypothetical protein